MNNPTLYVKLNDGDFDSAEFASNFEWLQKQAISAAGITRGRQVIYKLVPVFVASLKITTEVISEDIAAVQVPDDRRDWDEADRIEAERNRIAEGRLK